jgi:hypothetical protein
LKGNRINTRVAKVMGHGPEINWRRNSTQTKEWRQKCRNISQISHISSLTIIRPIEKQLTIIVGSCIIQAVSRWLPTAAVCFRAQVRSCEICGGQSGTGIGSVRVLRFPLPVSPPIAPLSSSSSSGASTVGQIVAGVPSGLSLTPPQETELIKTYDYRIG